MGAADTTEDAVVMVTQANGLERKTSPLGAFESDI